MMEKKATLSKRKLDRLKMSGKVDFRGKNITRDKEGGSFHNDKGAN